MDALTDALYQLLAGALNPVHWPFFTVSFTLAIIGQVLSTRVFTREQAYLARGNGWGRVVHGFFWWGRETLPAHPIVVGLLLALVWRDPEGQHWPWVQNVAYWTFCGASSLFGWIVLKAVAKHRGIVLSLPGDSSRPPH